MKWLKLDCDFSEDPKIQCLCREWGTAEAISFWVLLLAFVGKYGGLECRVKIDSVGKHSDKFAASKMKTKVGILSTRLSRLSQLSLICPSSWEQKREIYLPKMLKRVDDHTRKVRTNSGLTSNLVRTYSGVSPDKENEKEKEKESTKEKERERAKEIVMAAGFEILWKRYPVKDGRKEAERHFSASVKTEQDLTDIDIALGHYLEHVASNPWKRVKNGKTWFNNWRDWVNWIEPAKPLQGVLAPLKRIQEALAPVATADLAMQQFLEQEAQERKWEMERKGKP